MHRISGLLALGTLPDNHERLGPSVVKQCVGRIIPEGGETKKENRFFAASKDLAHHLYQKSHPKASPGVLAVVHVTESHNGNAFVSVLKIRHKDESFVRILGEALTQLEVEQVENMLLQDIQKGAIIPHPDRSKYDLKVVDRQATDDPAEYFTEGFLGCLTKKSDEHQVKVLVQELEKYARTRDLPVAIEKLPQVITGLRERDMDVTTSVVTEVVQEQGVFGPDFQPDDLMAYIEQSNLGSVDIPRDRFAGRGKKAEQPRRLIYRFRDPALRGVTLSGPPETLTNILSVDDDVCTFYIQTTRNGFHVDYK